MLIWRARVSVTRKKRGTGEFYNCNEMSVSKKSYLELMETIRMIMQTYENDMYCTTVVIQKINSL